jgi:hypothetical protein
LVYYFRRADGLIKIGNTGNLEQRLSAFRTVHGPLQIMLTHSGGA